MGGSGNGWVMLWVVGALFAALLTGFASRNMSGGNGVANQSAEYQAVEAPQSVEEASEEAAEDSDSYSHSGAVVLERSQDGHFYANTEINGQSIRMLVDTGATAIALSRADAGRAGVGVSISMPQVVGQGASGDVHGEVVMLERVTLGSKEAEEVAAVVLDDGELSLLGQSFLSKFDRVEIKGDEMVLR